AVKAARSALEKRLAKGDIADIVVLFGDAPMLRPEAIAALLKERRRAPAAAIVAAGMRPADPGPYGRFVLDPDGGLARIVEARDAPAAERQIGLGNGGIWAVDSRDLFDLVEPKLAFGPGVSAADRVRIRSCSHLEGATIASGAIIGPFARLRPRAVLEAEVHVGNFVEIKETRLGAGAKANHLSYLGDSEVGAGTNIGAGTIICNYDGFNKHRTVIGKDAFIGSNTALVAPVSVGDGAYVATGSVVTSDVPKDALTIARARQVDKPGRARELREKLRGKNK